jgi:small GTP-binding protein
MIGVEYRHNFKFIVIGSSGVGKTALVKRLVEGQFSNEGNSTIGVEYLTAVIEIDGQAVKLQLWDTAGQEKFRSIAKSYFRHAVGVILVYDITDRKSFDDLGLWLTDVHQLSDPNAAITLIGNKFDLAHQRAITSAEAQTFASSHGLTYLETSARSGDNVTEAFHRAARAVYERAESGALATKTVSAGQDLPAAGGSAGCGC